MAQAATFWDSRRYAPWALIFTLVVITPGLIAHSVPCIPGRVMDPHRRAFGRTMTLLFLPRPFLPTRPPLAPRAVRNERR